MSTYTPGCLNSEIFNVLADSGKRVFNVHSKVLTARSRPLEIIVNRALTGSEGRSLDFSNWDGDTVERFLDFLYSGNYQVPTPEPLSQTSGVSVSDYGSDEYAVNPPPTDQSASVCSDRSGRTVHESSTTSTDRPLTPLQQLHERFCKSGFGGDGGIEGSLERMLIAGYERVHTVEKDLDCFPPQKFHYDAILLAHAKLYALAQHQEVRTLQEFTFSRLLITLMPLEPYITSEHIAGDIVQLVQFIYENTGPQEPGGRDEPMRTLISQFVAITFPVLERTAGMKELLRQGGDMVPDILDKVRRRLVDSESQLKVLQAGGGAHENDALSSHLHAPKCDSTTHNSECMGTIHTPTCDETTQALEANLTTEKRLRNQAEQSLTVVQNLLKCCDITAGAGLRTLKPDMYQEVRIVTPKLFNAHQGYGLSHWHVGDERGAIAPLVYKIPKFTLMNELFAKVAADMGNVATWNARLWPAIIGHNRTIRSHPLTPSELMMPVSVFAETSMPLSGDNEDGDDSYSVSRGNGMEFLPLWVEVSTKGCPVPWVQDPNNRRILIHLKHFDINKQTLLGVGYEHIRMNDRIDKLRQAIISRMGWETDQQVDLCEEKRWDNRRIPASQIFFSPDIKNGVIICFGKPGRAESIWGESDAHDFYTHLH